MKEVYPQWKLKNSNSKFLSSPYPISPSPLLQDQELAFGFAFSRAKRILFNFPKIGYSTFNYML